jgi:hypothetical protein
MSTTRHVAGVRATHGITAGCFWFSVRILEPLETTAANIGESADAYNDDETTANTIHCCRYGSCPYFCVTELQSFPAADLVVFSDVIRNESSASILTGLSSKW